MIIVTAGRTSEEMAKQAIKIAGELNGRYISRKKRSIQMIQQIEADDCIVVGKERLELYPYAEKGRPFFFHPNSAMFRIKRLLNGEQDPFIHAACLEAGTSILDCTLGLASDSIVASFVVGKKGKVTGIEGNPYIAYIVKSGLKSWKSSSSEINKAMERVEVKNKLSLPYLKSLPDNSYDCVYIDPMFEENILNADGIQALKRFAVYSEITQEFVDEATRVARKRVIMKDHFRSLRFEKFKFYVYRRKTATFHFGVIEK